MILDLDPLPYRVAIDIIKWCFENNIDRSKALQLIDMMNAKPIDWPEHVDWSLDIPDSYASWLVLRFT
jgi:hypothetical protein